MFGGSTGRSPNASAPSTTTISLGTDRSASHGCCGRSARGAATCGCCDPRLDLDSGYLSRLLRSLEADALIDVRPSEHDRRVRTARLTTKGSAERALLDRRSDSLARSMLEPLDDPQRQRLVSAMNEVGRLFTAALVEIDAVDPAHHHAQHCLREYFAELDRRFDGGFDPERSISADARRDATPGGHVHRGDLAR